MTSSAKISSCGTELTLAPRSRSRSLEALRRVGLLRMARTTSIRCLGNWPIACPQWPRRAPPGCWLRSSFGMRPCASRSRASYRARRPVTTPPKLEMRALAASVTIDFQPRVKVAPRHHCEQLAATRVRPRNFTRNRTQVRPLAAVGLRIDDDAFCGSFRQPRRQSSRQAIERAKVHAGKRIGIGGITPGFVLAGGEFGWIRSCGRRFRGHHRFIAFALELDRAELRPAGFRTIRPIGSGCERSRAPRSRAGVGSG